MKAKTQACERCGGTGREPDQRAIGLDLRKLRKQAGISLRHIAKELNVSAPFLSDLERGRRNWTPERIEAYRTIITT